MEHTNRLLVAAAHVGYHVVAISCVSAFEAADQLFVGAFGHDFRRWPLIILAVVCVLVYIIGFASAVLIAKRLSERRAKRSRSIKRLPLIPSVEPQGEPRSAKPWLAASAMVLVSVAALARLTLRKRGD